MLIAIVGVPRMGSLSLGISAVPFMYHLMGYSRWSTFHPFPVQFCELYLYFQVMFPFFRYKAYIQVFIYDVLHDVDVFTSWPGYGQLLIRILFALWFLIEIRQLIIKYVGKRTSLKCGPLSLISSEGNKARRELHLWLMSEPVSLYGLFICQDLVSSRRSSHNCGDSR